MPDPVTVSLAASNFLFGPFINPTIGRLIEDWRKRRQLKKELPDKLDCFLPKLERIKRYIQDAEHKQGQNPDVRGWLEQLQETVYDAEDILDGYATDLAIQETKFDRKRKVSELVSLKHDPNRPAKTSKHQVAEDIDSINRKLDNLLKEGEQLGLNTRPDSSKLDMGSRESSSYFNEFENISLESREVIKNEIVEILLQDLNKEGANQPTLPTNKNERTHIPIIPITGMGGIGKTTLAKKIFDDDKVQSYFNTMRVWVCVSYNFEVKNIIKSIIEFIDRRPETESLQNLQDKLRKLIEGKKLLLVLDDVWMLKKDDWSKFIGPFQVMKKLCCCIIITTRNSDIKTVIKEDSLKTFPLDDLEFDESWELFHKIAFRDEKSKEGSYKQLEDIGRKVVRKLKGSPLAIKTVASLLGDERDELDELDVDLWLRVSESELPEIESKLSELTEGESNIYPILMLSYQHLPSELKECLFIFSLFPKDYAFSEDNIILLWLAYGIIGGENGKPEAQGRKYFQRLVDRSFLDVQRNQFQNTEYSMHYDMDGSFVDDSGNIFSIHDSTIVRPLSDVHNNVNQDKMCTMHDLIHDVVQSIFRPDCHFSSGESEHGYILKNWRHTSIYHVGKETVLYMDGDTRDSKEPAPCMQDDLRKKGDYEKARTLLLTGNILIDGKHFGSLVTKMIHLRVLRLVGLAIEKIPDSIGKLKHLRYLVVKTSATKLPDSICYLYNLQVLEIFESGIKDFPEHFTRLVNLRYILGDVENHCINIKGIGNLRMLRTLPRFRINENTGFDISELENLNELQGKLCIESLGHVKGKEAAERARLERKKNLKKLSFSWGTNTVDRSSKVDEEVFEALKPCEYIREIAVDGYQGRNLPSWMNDSDLHMLDVLKLKDCSRLRNVPPTIGEMSLLRCLHLCHLRSLSEIRPSGLISGLEELKLEDLPELVNCIVSGDYKEKKSPKLVSLTVRNCPKLELVVLPMLMAFNGVQGCDSHVYSTMVSIESMCIKGTPKLTCWYLPLPPADLDCLTIQGEEDTVDIRFCNFFDRWTGDDPWNISVPVPGVVAVKPLYEEKPEGIGFCSSDACSIIVSNCQDNAGDATASAASQAADGASEVHPWNTMQEMQQHQHPSLYVCNGLTSLTIVYISGCDSLVSCTLPTTMPSLWELEIRDCREMASLELPETMTSLARLGVWQCPSLKTCRLPPIPADFKCVQPPGRFFKWVRFSNYVSESWDIDSCEAWDIDSSNPELLFHFAGRSCPTGIKADELVSHFRDVTTGLAIQRRSQQEVTQLIMEAGAGHLESLSIEECSDLEFVHLEPILLCFTSLTTLHLSRCQQLKSLPPDVSSRLVCLRDIDFSYLPLQSPLDWSHLRRLKRFHLGYCEELTTLMLPPVIFEEVWLLCSGALTSVWFPPATAFLGIIRCPHLVINVGDPSSGEVAVSATEEGKADSLSLLQVKSFRFCQRHCTSLDAKTSKKCRSCANLPPSLGWRWTTAHS